MIATGWLLFRQQTSLMLLPGGSSACKFLSRTHPGFSPVRQLVRILTKRKVG
jgi:hypothetical protein